MIEVNILLPVVAEAELTKEIEDKVITFLIGIKRPDVYIELWKRVEFEKYFNIADGIYNPILKKMCQRRGFHFVEGGKHKIAMIFEYGWEKTLRHELTHVIQAETLGFELYEKLFKEIYLNKREIDPFELQAYFNEGN
jgi:hypothetical protein